jgi:hypothetical protein
VVFSDAAVRWSEVGRQEPAPSERNVRASNWVVRVRVLAVPRKVPEMVTAFALASTFSTEITTPAAASVGRVMVRAAAVASTGVWRPLASVAFAETVAAILRGVETVVASWVARFLSARDGRGAVVVVGEPAYDRCERGCAVVVVGDGQVAGADDDRGPAGPGSPWAPSCPAGPTATNERTVAPPPLWESRSVPVAARRSRVVITQPRS